MNDTEYLMAQRAHEMAIVEALRNVEGNVTVASGILTLPDGTALPLAVQIDRIAAAFRAAAQESAIAGELEIDDGAEVSTDDPSGAYVAAWVWVSNSEAGVCRCSACGRVDVEPADADQWAVGEVTPDLCPSCKAK